MYIFLQDLEVRYLIFRVAKYVESYLQISSFSANFKNHSRA